MLNAPEESELHAIKELARGCEKSFGTKQTAFMFAALVDRLDNFIEEHGDTAWLRRTQRLPIAAERQRATGRM